MTLKQARNLVGGEKLVAIVEDPFGGGSMWNPDKGDWDYTPIRAGQEVVFRRMIPKVRITIKEPWSDGHDEMLFCETEYGKRAWLNIGNANVVAK